MKRDLVAGKKMRSNSSFWPEDSSSTPSTSSSSHLRIRPPRHTNPNHSNVFQLIAQREISPRTKRSSRKLWGKASKSHQLTFGLRYGAEIDARRSLISWVESESLQNITATYCPLQPPPRSTIAAAFSPDGKTLASTHGDHTVKIIDCLTGRCLKVLSGHRRTPWVVRFHPLCPEILASGSLDQEVRLWDANTAECIGSCDFYRPIASIAFHALGEHLAVASGHKLYIWHYSRRGETRLPTIILETRRSLRAVHFHPYAAPFLLTAEVNELESSDSLMTLATSPGYLHYPLPAVCITDSLSSNQSNLVNEATSLSLSFLICPSNGVPLFHTDVDASSASAQQRTDPSSSVRLLTYSTPSGLYELLLSPIGSSDTPEQEEPQSNPLMRETENNDSQPAIDAMDVEVQDGESTQIFPFCDPAYWDLRLVQGWLISHSQAGQRTMRPVHGLPPESLSIISEVNYPAPTVSSMIPTSFGQSRSGRQAGLHHRISLSRTLLTTGPGEDPTNGFPHGESDAQPSINRIQSQIATSFAPTTSAELPCTVKLRIWSHDVKDSCARLNAERCRLTIPHAVLCSEMGAHFSPCGRFLAACVACILPNMDPDQGFHSQLHQDATGASASPTRHPIAGHRVMYELRIYSLEEATFGLVLVSRAIRAAHCLTSIQFSPTSEHLLLAYGRRHSSLLKSIVIDGDITVPIYTILEVYRVSDMELVRTLHSAEDEVNVACFHPSVGGGLVYGTKEGKLRILHYGPSHTSDLAECNIPIESIIEVETAV